MSGETAPDSSADFLSEDTIASLAKKLTGFIDQVEGERQQAMVAILVRMLSDPVEKLKLRGADACFTDEEEAIVQALQRDLGRQ